MSPATRSSATQTTCHRITHCRTRCDTKKTILRAREGSPEGKQESVVGSICETGKVLNQKLEDGLPHPPRLATSTPCCTRHRPLTFDLQNIIRSSVWASEYFRSVLSKLFKAFVRYRGNNICPAERTNAADGEPQNIMPSSSGEGISSENDG